MPRIFIGISWDPRHAFSEPQGFEEPILKNTALDKYCEGSRTDYPHPECWKFWSRYYRRCTVVQFLAEQMRILNSWLLHDEKCHMV
jgi:hypothetical protein